MAAGLHHRGDSRITPRFVPKDKLSIVLSGRVGPPASEGSGSSQVFGDVKNLSEVGACVVTNSALDDNRPMNVDVHYEKAFLFSARAEIVWRAPSPHSIEPLDCFHGVLFTDLSTFSRKLIRRIGGAVEHPTGVPPGSAPEARADKVCPDTDAEFFFPAQAQLASNADAAFDMLSDPVLEAFLTDGNFGTIASAGTPESLEKSRWAGGGAIWQSEHVSVVDVRNVDPDPSASVGTGAAELSGNLGYFNSADLLQMLEAAQATGIVYLDGEDAGELHLQGGRICGLFSNGVLDEETAVRLILSRRGRFRFVPTVARSNLRKCFTTTELLLEAEHRRGRLGSSTPARGQTDG